MDLFQKVLIKLGDDQGVTCSAKPNKLNLNKILECVIMIPICSGHNVIIKMANVLKVGGQNVFGEVVVG